MVHPASAKTGAEPTTGGKGHLRAHAIQAAVAVAVLVLLFWFGKHLADELKVLEDWIASLGVWGPVVFIVAVVVLTSVFVPDSLLAVAAGVTFGLVWGTVFTFVGATLTAVLNYLVARSLFRRPIESLLARYPKFTAIQAAANREGFRLLFLLRLSPINPVSVSYVLGAGGIRFGPFLAASLGLLPSLFVEVYFGQTAKHFTQVSANPDAHSTLHTALTVSGLIVCVLLVVYIARVAQRALAEAEASGAH